MTESADFLGRGWKYPVSATNSNIAMSEGEAGIYESILLILGTSKGERIMRPEFGCDINDLVFEVNNSATTTMVGYHVEEALNRWEPRINVMNVSVYTDSEERHKLNIEIEYEIKSSNSKANLVYPFYLEGEE